VSHPTNANWNGTYSIPKGMIENNESSIDAAIRETFEETGIKILKEQINPTEYCIDYKNSKGTIYKKVFYFIANVENLPDVLPKNQIQMEEVDWVGFLDKNDAESKIFWRFKEMLNHLN
jgi:8-oxo-dGTP pyrophosphatase MutT (NUDIX family)